MKLESIKPLNESVTFSAAMYEERNGEKYLTHKSVEVEKPCWVCDGKGYEEYGGKRTVCEYCKGKKTYMDEDIGPELNVSNGNAALIARMLGLDDEDYAGVIWNKDIPAKLQILMRLKNTKSGVDAHTRPDETTQGKVQSFTDENGQSRIGRSGPTVHSMGADAEQVMRYVDKLIEILKYAKDNDMHVSWG